MSAATLEAQLRFHVEESITLHIYPNATFLAERLYAAFPTDQNLYTMANAYAMSGDYGTCYRLLKEHYPFRDPAYKIKCFYLMGVSCANTNRHAECEKIMQDIGINHAGVNYWLGVCAKRLGRKFTVEYFETCARQNPAIFVAFEQQAKLAKSGLTPCPYDGTEGPSKRESSKPAPPLRPPAKRPSTATVGTRSQAQAASSQPADDITRFLRPYAEALTLLYSYRR